MQFPAKTEHHNCIQIMCKGIKKELQDLLRKVLNQKKWGRFFQNNKIDYLSLYSKAYITGYSRN